MDELYNLEDLTFREIKALSKSLEFIPITGIDAMFIGMLQVKLLNRIKEIESQIQNAASLNE
jgi:hypothetical protein